MARPFFVCGAGQQAGFVAGLAGALKAEKIFTVNSADTTRDLILVDDVVEGLIRLALSREARGEVVNVCSGKEFSMGKIALAAHKIIDKGKVVLKHQNRPGDFLRSQGSNKKIKYLTGWKPTRPLAEILRSALR